MAVHFVTPEGTTPINKDSLEEWGVAKETLDKVTIPTSVESISCGAVNERFMYAGMRYRGFRHRRSPVSSWRPLLVLAALFTQIQVAACTRQTYCPDNTVLPYAERAHPRLGSNKVVVLSTALFKQDLCPPAGLTFLEATKLVSTSTSNQVWRYAVQRLIDSDTCDVIAPNLEATGQFDALILATSNLLLPAELIAAHPAQYAGFIREAQRFYNWTIGYNIPTTMVGIGTNPIQAAAAPSRLAGGLQRRRTHAAYACVNEQPSPEWVCDPRRIYNGRCRTVWNLKRQTAW